MSYKGDMEKLSQILHVLQQDELRHLRHLKTIGPLLRLFCLYTVILMVSFLYQDLSVVLSVSNHPKNTT